MAIAVWVVVWLFVWVVVDDGWRLTKRKVAEVSPNFYGRSNTTENLTVTIPI